MSTSQRHLTLGLVKSVPVAGGKELCGGQEWQWDGIPEILEELNLDLYIADSLSVETATEHVLELEAEQNSRDNRYIGFGLHVGKVGDIGRHHPRCCEPKK